MVCIQALSAMVRWSGICALTITVAADAQAVSQAFIDHRSQFEGQVLVELMTRGAPERLFSRFGTNEVTVNESEHTAPCAGVRLFSLSIDQAADEHPLLVARVGSQAFLLGGFTAPEAIAFGAAIPEISRATCLSSAALVRLLDPHGAISVQPSTSNLTSIARWRENPDARGWLGDTVLQLSDHRRLERSMVFSRTDGPAPQWIPILYVFAYGREGELVGWTRRIGPPIGP